MPEIGISKFNAGTIDSSKNGASGNFTAVEGTTYSIDMSTGSPSADLVITLPTPSQGDACSFILSGSDVSSYGVDFIGKIGTVDYSSGNTYKLLKTGDYVVFRYVDGNVGWLSDVTVKQTGVSFELETLDTLDGAWSLQQAVTGYSGNVVRVRRASDNAEQDIGLDSTALDVASLETFCAATDGFVVTWYDQSGNAVNLSQAATADQPKIVSAGTYLTHMEFDTGDGFDMTITATGSLVTGSDEHTFITESTWSGVSNWSPYGNPTNPWRISTLAQYNASLSAESQTRAVDMVVTYDANAVVDNFSGTMQDKFQGRSDIVTLPDGLFDSNTDPGPAGVFAFAGTFSSCSNLTAIPAGLFPNDMTGVNGVGPFLFAFYGCTSLTSIPAGLFDNNPLSGAVNSSAFQDCFHGCTSLTTIPAGLFDNLTGVYDNCFRSCFRGCTSLTAIPAGLFANIPLTGEGSSFREVFQGCTSLTTIPSGLFNGFTGGSRTFQNAFSGCTSLPSIPSGLFDSVTTGTNSFHSTFSDCTSLSSIPLGLLDFNTTATTFQQIFQNCSSLTSIPAGLFDFNTALTNGTNIFDGCTLLSTVPAGIFDNNTNCTNYNFAFRNCALTQASVDNILVSLDSHATSSGTIGVDGGASAVPGTTGSAAKTNLEGRSWTVNTNPISLALNIVGSLDGAWSLQQAVTDYSGNIVRVRRSSDNAEQDIGLIGTALDVAALETFCAATDGFVVTWYDQSGNTVNLSQAATADQPKIVSAGTYLTHMEFDTGDNFDMTITSTGSLITGSDEHTFITESTWSGVSNWRPYGNTTNPWRISTLAQYNASLSAGNQTAAIDMVVTYDANAVVDNFSGDMQAKFNGRSDIVTLPDGLFDSCTVTTTSEFFYYQCFQNCTSLTTIPAGLFTNDISGVGGGFGFEFCSTFNGCTSLTTIPAGLFDAQVSLAEIAFYQAFKNCTSLTTIPAGLFDNNTLVGGIGFSQCFQNCTSLTTIPAGLFSTSLPNLNPEGKFKQTFSGCTSLNNIPSDIFPIITVAVSDDTFQQAFENCTSLTFIPTGLFDDVTGVDQSSFLSTFEGCTSLTTVPAGIFDDNASCTDYFDCFFDCALTQLSVDHILVSLDSHATSNGRVDLSGGTSAAPGAAGATAKTNLQGRSWSVTTN